MLFCHRVSKRAQKQQTDDKDINYSPCASVSPSDSSTGNEWRLPSILTAGSLDELSTEFDAGPVIPSALETRISDEMTKQSEVRTSDLNVRDQAIRNDVCVSAKKKRHPLVGSMSMHSLMSSGPDFAPFQQKSVKISNKNDPVDSAIKYYDMSTDGTSSLPLSSSSTRKKSKSYGNSLLLLGQHSNSASRSTLKKLRSLDVGQFSSMIDFRERFNDPWVGSISRPTYFGKFFHSCGQTPTNIAVFKQELH